MEGTALELLNLRCISAILFLFCRLNCTILYRENGIWFQET